MPTANDCTLLLSYHHIETHFGYCTKQKLSTTVYPVEMCFYMVGAPGFEPEIGRLKVCCDTVSPHPRYLITLVTTHDSSPFVKIKIARDLTRQGRVWLCVGARERIRTSDPLLRRQVL